MEQKSLNLIWWGVAFPLAALMTLGFVVATDRTLPAWDTAFLLRLHRYATPQLNQFMAIATDMGTFWGVLPVSVGMIGLGLWQGQRRAAAFLGLVMGGSACLNMVAKLLWHRVRPSLWEGIPLHSDFSFPSGHATYSMALVLALILIYWHTPRRPWLVLFGGLFVLFVGFSRVYLGVHFPSDIVGGWLLATAWTVGMYQLLFDLPPIKL
ncbi:phosphatase PAP2 family protein [Nodosilinea sp. P-1105]|uniref:phosphatase PAP2 family protein n=1 Tax=Nodosilinea sp. P-1105 TaxID=2546229 RepID=UPI00146F3BE0|nr:phosphatase PAP2 family protein [Nodosilinea sp. P-1105]NMF86052.1 phosphatase PAP2 family protein [Nodosilinea sp. P-1105]